MHIGGAGAGSVSASEASMETPGESATTCRDIDTGDTS
jgi:hypothetical protein